jgi:hypothetical protein
MTGIGTRAREHRSRDGPRTSDRGAEAAADLGCQVTGQRQI